MGLGIKLCGGYVKLEMPIRHSNEDVMWQLDLGIWKLGKRSKPGDTHWESSIYGCLTKLWE